MRKALCIGMLFMLVTACADSADTTPAPGPMLGSGGVPAHATAQKAGPPGTGLVLETMNSGGYTYVNVRFAGGEAWAAGPEVAVAKGATVSVSDGMPMRDYHSKSLDRTFPLVYFVNSIKVEGAATVDPRLAAAHGTVGKPAPAAVAPVEKLEGGQSVEDVVRDAAKLSGADVAIRGRVVKYNAGILGKNWLHIQDGSGADLTVTTQDTAAVGDLVVVRGKVALDKDFGGGYVYPVIVEGATVETE